MSLGEKLTIQTPEQIDLEYSIAGPGSRFMALFVDMMIQVVATFVVVIVLAILGIAGRLLLKTASTWAMAAMVLSYFLLQWGYFVAFEIFWKGQTPGKRQAGIRVINESGREASVYEAVTRNLLRAVDALPGVYAVGAVVMFISPQNKRIGDYAAGTIVVHDRRPEDDSIFFNTRDADVSHTVDYGKLTPQDVHVIEAFLQRRLDLESSIREKTAERLADHFGQKCSVEPGDRRDRENFLEILVRGFRRDARYKE